MGVREWERGGGFDWMFLGGRRCGGSGGMVEDSSWKGCGGSVLDLENVLGALCWVGWGVGKEGVLGGILRLEMDRMLAWVVTFEQSGQYVLHGVSCVQKKG